MFAWKSKDPSICDVGGSSALVYARVNSKVRSNVDLGVEEGTEGGVRSRDEGSTTRSLAGRRFLVKL